ncbi:hypothetical protein BYT27DRAFT_7113240 [Phlegmacium glaucopus]|nr:hypothetical protein BYT27DRAFT_7113240 [Phlegmacium glaucopus]
MTSSSSSWKSRLCHWNWNLNLNSSWLSSLKRRIRFYLTRFSPYTIYPTASEEQKYWNQAARGQRELQRSDARFAGTKVRNLQPNTLPGRALDSDSEPRLPPLVMYYVPALLPAYRDASNHKAKSRKTCRKPYVSPKIYCKWHRMVFPGSDHPTMKEASKLRNLYDPQDMQEICRISRMLPDNVIFPLAPAPPWTWTPKYHIIWQKWLASKPPLIYKI